MGTIQAEAVVSARHMQEQCTRIGQATQRDREYAQEQLVELRVALDTGIVSVGDELSTRMDQRFAALQEDITKLDNRRVLPLSARPCMSSRRCRNLTTVKVFACID